MSNQHHCVSLDKNKYSDQNQQGYNYGQPGQNQQGYNYGQPGQNQQGYNYGQPGQNQQGYNYGQPGQNQQGYNRVPPKFPAGMNIFTVSLEYVRKFFSPDPTAAADMAVNEKEHIWSLLGSAYILVVTMAIFGILRNSVMSVLLMIPGYSYFIYDIDITSVKIKLFFMSLIIMALFFCASTGIAMLFSLLQKQKPDFFKSMNILSAAGFPLTLCGAATFLFSFIYVPFALIFLISGVILKCFMLYEALKKVAGSDKSVIWYVFGTIVANVTVFGLITIVMFNIFF